MSNEREEFLAPGRAQLANLQRIGDEEGGARRIASIRGLVNGVLTALAGRPIQSRLFFSHDRGVWDDLLDYLLRRVERACARLGIEPLPAVAIGALVSAELSPLSSHAFGSSAMIAIPSGTMVFANQLAKALLPLVCSIAAEHNEVIELKLGSPSQHHSKEALKRFRDLMAAVAIITTQEDRIDTCRA